MEQRRSVCELVISEFPKASVRKICKYSGLSKTSFYYPKSVEIKKSTGRPKPGYTVNRDGLIVLDSAVVELLKKYRSEPEFISGGGYQKLTQHLRIEHNLYINHKKIYRLCEENNILLFKQRSFDKKKVKKRRCGYVEVTAPNQLWQFDLKYGYIHGENRWFFVLAFIDVFSKKVPNYYIGTSCKAGDLITTLNQALINEGITVDHKLVIRSDNGPQMSSNKFYFYLKRLEQKLSHEFIPVRTPNRNAYIESFFSILENELLKDRYFKTYGEAYEKVVWFINFYNERRIHGSIKNMSPKMFIEQFNSGKITAIQLSV